MVVLFPAVATAAALDFVAVIVLAFVVTYVRRVHATVSLSLSLSLSLSRLLFFLFFNRGYIRRLGNVSFLLRACNNAMRSCARVTSGNLKRSRFIEETNRVAWL